MDHENSCKIQNRSENADIICRLNDIQTCSEFAKIDTFYMTEIQKY
jgi:hypothetical protein